MDQHHTKNAHKHFEAQPYSKDSLRDWYGHFKTWMQVKQYSSLTIASRQHHLRYFILWCEEQDIHKAQLVTKPILDRYQRQLFTARKTNGEPLSLGTQNARLLSVKAFFRWMMQHNLLLFNPASELEGPKVPYVLPRLILSVSQVEEVLSQADLQTHKGIRDRAIMEVFYSTGIRRIELIHLQLDDIDWSRETLFIRQGKGYKDRVIPVGTRALLWIKKYLEEVRAFTLTDPSETALFLTPEGDSINPKRLTAWIKTYLQKAGIKKRGSCHIFRHTVATLMLENGADTRYIQQLLGHAKLETTQIYTQVSITKLKEIHRATHPAKVPKGFSID
jgi:integrase/recombinase XerD